MKTKSAMIDGYMTRHTLGGDAIRSELENLWENGYIHGRRDFGAIDVTEELHRQYNKGYANGHDAGKDEAYKELSGRAVEEDKAKIEAYKLGHDRGYDKGYATGLEEARDQNYQNGYDKGADDGRYELWRVIKKLFLVPDEGGFSIDDISRIFGVYINFSGILRNYTPEEVIEKVKSYEESKKSAPTNRDKFEEVFGLTIECNTNLDRDRRAFTIQSKDEGWRKKQSEWLDLPYEEPEDNDNA